MNVPFDKQIWSAQHVADYWGVSKSHFLNCIQHMPGFPKPLDFPSYIHAGKERQLEPRWCAAEIAAFALKSRTSPAQRSQVAESVG